MNKVIKHDDVQYSNKLQSFSIEEFSSVERGVSFFSLHPFNDETSVQDDSLKFSMDSGHKSYSPTPSMFNQYADSVQVDAFDNADFDASRGPRLFGSFDDDFPSDDGNLFAKLGGGDIDLSSANPFFEQFEKASVDAASAETPDFAAAKGFQEVSIDLPSDNGAQPAPSSAQPHKSDDMSWQDTEKLIEKMLEEQVAVAEAAQKEAERFKAELEVKEKEMEELKQKLAALEGLPAQVEAARADGFTRGKAEGTAEGAAQAKAAADAEEKRRYDGERQDYMQLIQDNWNEALAEVKKYDDAIKSMDEQVPEIVVGYLRELIGAERKLNDGFVVNLIKSAISKLTDKQQLLFTINPADADIVTEAFPQYGVSIDSSIAKGGVKIQTKTGNVDLSVDAWIDSLEQQINEQVRTA